MDYRFFPEPDLPALVLTQAEVVAVRDALPELPEARQKRFQQEYGVTAYEAGMLLQSPAFAEYFERVARASGQGKATSNWMLGEVSRVLNDSGGGIRTLPLEPRDLADLIRLVDEGMLNLNTAKESLFPALLRGEGTPRGLVDRLGLAQVSDRVAIEQLVQAVLAAHPGQVEQVRAGADKLRGFLVGQVMKAGQGRVNPQRVHEILNEALDGGTPTA